MRTWFLEQPDDEKWLWDWYNSIGFRLAIGHDFAKIRVEFEGYVLHDEGRGYYEASLAILDWLDERYTTNSFHSHR